MKHSFQLTLRFSLWFLYALKWLKNSNAPGARARVLIKDLADKSIVNGADKDGLIAVF